MMCCVYGACSNASENNMNKKRLMYALLLPVMFFSIGQRAVAQDSSAKRYEDNERMDSLARASGQQEAAKDEQRKNSQNLSDLKSDKKETKAKAKNAQRVEEEANDAARESKMAYKKEKKAQKAREQADKQTKKAKKAKTKSDEN